MVAAGVFERYPGLNLVVAEAGVGWLPFFAQEFDYYQMSFGPSSSGLGRQRDLPQPPSACIWPGATQFIAQDLGHLMPEARAKVLCRNAARLYNDGQLPPPPDAAEEVKDLEAWNKVHWGE
jgi:hypothetical protein